MVLEGLALDVLHDDVVRAVDRTPVVDVDDVGVVDAGRGLGLAPEALDELAVAGVAVEQHLDGDTPAERRVFGQVDVGHAAGPQPPQHAVPVGDHLPLFELVAHKLLAVTLPHRLADSCPRHGRAG